LQSSPFDGLKEVYLGSTERQAMSVIDRIAHRMSQCHARRILTTCMSETRDVLYGMSAGGLSPTFCGSSDWDHL
jgi:hypothetical protein